MAAVSAILEQGCCDTKLLRYQGFRNALLDSLHDAVRFCKCDFSSSVAVAL